MDIRISDYNYTLPDERIAKYPVAERDHSKLLVYQHGTISEDHFYNLPNYLPAGALLVYNNTRVIRARMLFRKPTGAHIEIFLLEPYSPADYEQTFQSQERCSWLCLVGNQKKWKEGQLQRVLQIDGREIVLTATHLGPYGTSQLIEFRWECSDSTAADGKSVGCPFSDIIDAAGELPIPPYLNRQTEEADNTTYQTVYSRIKGSVAAPTAGLHFTSAVLSDIDARGLEREEVTLHVGAGTFRPVKSENVADHEMHSEHISVTRATLLRLIAHDGKAIAVGTTSVRTLESLYYVGCKLLRQPNLTEEQLYVTQWEPYDESAEADAPTAKEALQAIVDWLDAHQLTTLHTATQIIIVPGYRYHIVEMLITNFHQPQSTLLLLVSAFLHGDWRRVYDYALAHDFRFLSYGDSSLLIP
ncbi:MAG: S-adenosylmethionine:tRNA ribosyltransferase-isomerase [Prevotella sp.]|nr:S-adenosylmethionine:tRNA ribosyltransferase-isomerase [Prevotella sp.]MBR0526055.1 S-adenosylmethionine:tRNA ribosyltransferase-isomerase [Prevotella sp.]